MLCFADLLLLPNALHSNLFKGIHCHASESCTCLLINCSSIVECKFWQIMLFLSSVCIFYFIFMLVEHLAYALWSDPDHVRGQRNKRYYEELLSVEGHQEPPALKNERPYDGYKSSSEFATYEALCRGEKTHVSILFLCFFKEF